MIRRSRMDEILEPGGLTVVFQPIIELSPEGRRLHALEILSRGPQGTNMESPEILFEYARRKHCEGVIDRLCVGKGLREATEISGDPVISVNVHASTLCRDAYFPGFLDETASGLGIPLSRIIVEIVEYQPVWDGPTFLDSIAKLRKSGAQIALDDIGQGQSNYRMILDVRPDYFKLDRYFVSGCPTDPYRRAVLESISGLARKFGAQAVAEGVETEEELAVVRDLGIDLVQGWLFSPAVPSWALRHSGLVTAIAA
jgi:EAL domain-containing protein (putative c-di-GMP-specific phosphodiesterase class I)